MYQKKQNQIKQKLLRNNKIINIKKRSLIYLLKQKKLKYSFFLKKKKILNIILKNKNKINLIFKNKYYVRMSIYRKRKNVFLNYSNIFSGNVYSNYSCGCYFKGSLRKTYYAIESLLLKSNIFRQKNLNKIWFNNKKKKMWLYLTIKGNYYTKGFKKNIKKFIDQKNNFLKLKNYCNIQFKAHNGIRKCSKRRK